MRRCVHAPPNEHPISCYISCKLLTVDPAIVQKTDIKITGKNFSFKGGECELSFDFFGEVRA